MTQQAPDRRRGRMVALATLILLLFFGAGIYGGIRRRIAAETALAFETEAAAVPSVDAVRPQGDAPGLPLVLPGQTTAFIDTPIYARTGGYLKEWHFDIGARVHRGDLLARIEAPELDQQLREAQAQLTQTQAALVQAQAGMDLARVTSDRSTALAREGWTSQQVGDRDRLTYAGRTAAVNAARATLQAQQAQVDRLQHLTDFERVTAPFDGVITARNTDVGALINAGSGNSTTELFHMAATETLRIFVAVPEVNSPDMRVGATPTVTLDEYPGEVFHGTLVRTGGAINVSSRTLLVEVDVDNRNGKLLPGAYASVRFTLPGRTQSLTLPANTLLFRREGLRVAVVCDGTAELVPIRIGRDYGDRVEVLSGLQATDLLIVNPSDSLISGTAVRLMDRKPETGS